jgi:hypothetical protein
MSFFGLCKQDELINTLRDTFGANPVRVPEKRVQPLCVIATRGDDTAFRGALAPLLTGSPKFSVPKWARASSPIADMSRMKSSSVKLSLGLDILGKFLSGFGVPSAGIETSFSGAKEVAFSFSSIDREWIDDNWLGRALVGRSLDLQNISARLYTQQPVWDLLLIDSIIRSSRFSISVTKSRANSFAINVPAVHALVAEAKAGVEVKSTNKRQLTFHGPDALTFAFTTVRLFVDSTGNILGTPPNSDSVLLAVATGNQVPTYGLDHVELSKTPAMVEWDEIG